MVSCMVSSELGSARIPSICADNALRSSTNPRVSGLSSIVSHSGKWCRICKIGNRRIDVIIGIARSALKRIG